MILDILYVFAEAPKGSPVFWECKHALTPPCESKQRHTVFTVVVERRFAGQCLCFSRPSFIVLDMSEGRGDKEGSGSVCEQEMWNRGRRWDASFSQSVCIVLRLPVLHASLILRGGVYFYKFIKNTLTNTGAKLLA